MADDNTQAGATAGAEEELTIVEVEQLPDPNAEPPAPKPAPAADSDDDDDEDGDARLGADEHGDREDDAASESRRRRQERKAAQKRARERLENELAQSNARASVLEQRLAALETNTVMSRAEQLRQQHAQTLADIRQAEAIEAEALEANNGRDAVTARNIREAAMRKANALEQEYHSLAQPQEGQQPQTIADDTRTRLISNAKAWQDANPWYDHDSSEPIVILTKQIDAQLVREGSDPSDRRHWVALSQRLNEQLDKAPKADAGTPRQKAPPSGGGREHAPTSTRNEIYVTPERKQAMIDAGAWDDPARRNRMLKAYQEYDRNSAR